MTTDIKKVIEIQNFQLLSKGGKASGASNCASDEALKKDVIHNFINFFFKLRQLYKRVKRW